MLTKELDELKLQSRITAESRDNSQRESKQLQFELVRNKELVDTGNKDNLELKRVLKDAEMEKVFALTSANELRELIKATEGKLLVTINYKVLSGTFSLAVELMGERFLFQWIYRFSKMYMHLPCVCTEVHA